MQYHEVNLTITRHNVAKLTQWTSGYHDQMLASLTLLQTKPVQCITLPYDRTCYSLMTVQVTTIV